MSTAEISKARTLVSKGAWSFRSHVKLACSCSRSPAHPCNKPREHRQEAEEGTCLQDCLQEGICKMKTATSPLLKTWQEAENCPSQLYAPEIQVARCIRARRTVASKDIQNTRNKMLQAEKPPALQLPLIHPIFCGTPDWLKLLPSK